MVSVSLKNINPSGGVPGMHMFNPINGEGSSNNENEVSFDDYIVKLKGYSEGKSAFTSLPEHIDGKANEKLLFNEIQIIGIDEIEKPDVINLINESKILVFPAIDRAIDAKRYRLASRLMEIAKKKKLYNGRYFYLRRLLNKIRKGR